MESAPSSSGFTKLNHPAHQYLCSTLQVPPHDDACKTRGQDGFATSFPVGLLHPLQHAGLSRRTLPTANAAEAAVVEGVNVYPVSSLTDVLDLLNTSVVGVIQREPYRVNTQELLGELQHFS